MKRAAAWLCALALGAAGAPAGPLSAGDSPADAARAAAHQLETAETALQQAEKAHDRVRALTDTVRAYEAGLAAMRDGLRRASTRETQLRHRLEARESEVARLLGVMLTIETAPPPVLMLHPAGPLGSARSGMILADVTPGLNARAQELRRDLEEVRTLRTLQEEAAKRLEDGLAGVQQARADLSQAIADRTDLPQRFVEDPVRTAILLDSTETLAGFASGLSLIGTEEIDDTEDDISALKGTLPLPVQGTVLHRAGESDAAGIRRDGLLMATRPRALVTSPSAATIRYRGPLLDLGNVVILEPQADLLFVLSGLETVYGEIGQVVPAGTPVGLMGGAMPETGAILSTSGDGTGTDRSETLYIEVRQGGRPVNPETWFRSDKDG
ncbi:murein hydrolase activator EnvC family protein [Albibacillus kandeliae]|uniref:murein hydrolase activator EnvC family protein n=1 Tax=Albibacillus kandeliae TaxID=2174228 RepID=UPI000D6992D8|nr:peptidoglycan DD-metalloendopeptidase family protein [Albibacillus kandeliae]